jgi:RHS repeat-associated protein
VIAEYGAAPVGASNIRYYHPDRLSTRMITDNNGGVVGAQDHLPFGEDGGVTGENEKHRFTNYERDAESGTDYAVNRQYSNSTGRFLQADLVPGGVFQPQSMNRFSYCYNDPESYYDPDGRIPLLLVTGIVGALVGAVGSAIGQVIANGGFDNFSWKAVAVGAGVGFATGLAAPYVATTYLGASLLAAASNTVQYIATQYVTDQPITLTGIGISAGTGAVAGLIAGPVTRNSGIYMDRLNPFIQNKDWYRAWNNWDDITANLAFVTLLRNALGGIVTNVVPVPTGGSNGNSGSAPGVEGRDSQPGNDGILPVPQRTVFQTLGSLGYEIPVVDP